MQLKSHQVEILFIINMIFFNSGLNFADETRIMLEKQQNSAMPNQLSEQKQRQQKHLFKEGT